MEPWKDRRIVTVAGVCVALLLGLLIVVHLRHTKTSNQPLPYSAYAPGELVLADDSGLEVDALNGAPGVHSARYAAGDLLKAQSNADDEANNAKLIRELNNVPLEKRTARFVCVIAVARDRRILATVRGVVEGNILTAPRGSHGFGYDPLFYLPAIEKTLAELTPVEKAAYSHRGVAFQKFLSWYGSGKTASTM